MTITLAQHDTYRAALDRRIAEAHRLRRERLERHAIQPTACAIDEAAEAMLDAIAEVPRDEVYERRSTAVRRSVQLRHTGGTLFARIVAWCGDNGRPDGSIDRAALYAALAVGGTTVHHVRIAAAKLRGAGRLPYRMDPLPSMGRRAVGK